MTNKPKSITLQEFEELAKAFVQTDIQTQQNYYDYEGYKLDDDDVASNFVGLFKAFAFKEELEKDQRRKDYEKLKEEYFKLKDEFEPDCDEEVKEEYVVSFIASDGELYKAISGKSGTCEGCAFIDKHRDCREGGGLIDCGMADIIWIKA